MEHSFDMSGEPMAAESQPTQLINNVLSGASLMEPPRKPREPVDAHSGSDEPNYTKDSFDSSASSVRNSGPQYQFHGLAVTQSQTQHDACVGNEGSQKENTSTSGELHGVNQQPCSPHIYSSIAPTKMLNDDQINKGSAVSAAGLFQSVSSEHTSPLKNTSAKAVSFQSPRTAAGPSSLSKSIQPSKTMPSRSSHYYRRSPSQDSFADPMSQDVERQFIAKTKAFDLPLSDLDIPSTQEMPSTDTQPVTSSGTGSSMHYTIASAYKEEKTQLSTQHYVPPHGQILVATTPSNSGSSQSQTSQHSQDAVSFYGRQLENTQQSTQIFEDSSEPSSSYERLLAGETSCAPTQVAEPEATQLNIPRGDSNVGNVDSSTQPTWQAQAVHASAPSTHTRSLADTVNKKWRLDRLGLTAQPRRPMNIIGTPTSGEVIPETPRSDISTAPRKQSEVIYSHNSGPVHKVDLRVPLSPGRSDAMEVVPDSEPPASGTTPVRPENSPMHIPNVSSKDMLHSPRKPHMAKVNEDDDDDEEDVPLATTVALNKGKGRLAAPLYSDEDTMVKTTRQRRTLRTAQALKGQSRDVPSSAHDQEEPPSARITGPAIGKGPISTKGTTSKFKGIKPTSTTSDRKTKLLSNMSSKGHAKRRRIESDTEDDDELRLAAKDLASIPKAEKNEEEEGTEPADEDDMDVDVPESDVDPGTSTRKRKRGSKTNSGLKAVSRASAKPNKLGRSTPTLQNQMNKRLRSVTSTSRAFSEQATRVFAVWKQDSHFYSGVVHALCASTKFLIKFDDNTEDTVDITKMRKCELKAGDDVILVDDNRKAKVKETKRGQKEVCVEVDDGDELEIFDVGVHNIRIAARTVFKQWEDRMLEMESIIPVIRPKSLKSTPSPSKASLLSTASGKSGRSKALHRTGLVITLSVGNANWEQEKDNVTSAIKNNGGTVIEDWSHIFPMEGKHSNMNKRWIASADDVQWQDKDGIQRVFLLADDPNQKPKYLIALALGIPCLSIDWLHDTIEKGPRDWQPYLLPAGTCDELNARVSQMVDLDWGNSIEHISDIMANQVASKIFAHKSVLCLGAEFVPLPKGKKNNTEPEKAKEASRTVPRIVLAMGASRVEAVTDLKYSSDQSLNTFQYVVVKDSDGIIRSLTNPDVALVHIPWVKDCLIAGRLLPTPDW